VKDNLPKRFLITLFPQPLCGGTYREHWSV